MPSGPEKLSRVAIVGASSLRGKELKVVLEERNFPASEIVLLDESVAAGTLTEVGGEPGREQQEEVGGVSPSIPWLCLDSVALS